MPQVDFPNGENVYYGNGAVYFADVSGTKAGGEVFVGNVTKFGVTVSGNRVEKRSRVNKERGIYHQKTTSTDVRVALTCDEATKNNILLQLQALEGSDVQGAGTLVDFDIPEPAWRFDLWYDLGKRVLSAVTVEHVVETVDTLLVLGEDYELDVATGRIRILSGGDAVEGELLKINATYAASTRASMAIGKGQDVERRIRFIGGSSGGPNYDVLLHRCYIRPNGETGFIQEGDDPGTFEFEATILDDTENHPNDPFGIVWQK
jgi:hypothetical protein